MDEGREPSCLEPWKHYAFTLAAPGSPLRPPPRCGFYLGQSEVRQRRVGWVGGVCHTARNIRWPLKECGATHRTAREARSALLGDRRKMQAALFTRNKLGSG